MGEDRSMSLEQTRDLVERAVAGMVSGDFAALELFTDDVVGDSPNMDVRSRSELEFQLVDRQGGLSNIEIEVDSIEPVESGVLVRWRAAVDHTGELLFNEDMFIEPSGRRLHLPVTTVLQFRGDRICAFHTEYDAQDLFDQMRGPKPSPESQ